MKMITKWLSTEITPAKALDEVDQAQGRVAVREGHVDHEQERVAGGGGEGGTKREKGRVVSRSKSKSWGRGQ